MNKPLKCRHHGLTSHKVIENPTGKDLTLCLLCSEDIKREEAMEIERLKERGFKKLQKAIDTNLLNAAIMPRFSETTLENYEVTNDKQKEALKTIYWFLDNLDQSVGLLIIGDPGTGKNHLATAIVKEVIQQGKTALITKLRKIDRKIKETYRTDEKESDVIKAFVDVDLLVIDEVGRQRDTKDEVLHIEELIDDRYEGMKPTILVGNVNLDEIKKFIGERSYSRFEKTRGNGRVIICDWPKWRGK